MKLTLAQSAAYHARAVELWNAANADLPEAERRPWGNASMMAKLYYQARAKKELGLGHNGVADAEGH